MFWKLFKSESSELKFFEIQFGKYNIFGVTAVNAQEAIDTVCEHIFHNQTIPGLPKATELSKKDVFAKYSDIPKSTISKKGIWFDGK